ncbi:probable adenylate kinase 6, chloroplastic [Tanacetum coccineum]|uniref:Probable adenylate kinase 6, chloroplastic n=1 Tax=Tanacetum coccineum TaxID=301880 RepID=A0ABQ4ZTG1_9ASTR
MTLTLTPESNRGIRSHDKVNGALLPCAGFFINSLGARRSRPVEEFYRSRGKLLEFDLPGGIPESWTKLLQALNLDDHEDKRSAAA